MTKSCLKYHVIFVTKYRKKLITNELSFFIKDIFSDISMKNNFKILIQETDKDHIHLLIELKPENTVSKIVSKLKQISTKKLYEFYGHILKKYYYKYNIFWSGSYYINSVGENDIKTIFNYIKNQNLK